ncbi:MAG: LptF/LptG family permease [Trueperaceae bacterium]
MTRFSRYLIAEIVPLYLAGLALLLLLLLGNFLLGVVADVLARGVPVTLLAQYLLFKLPAAAGAGIPLALLFAALLGLARISQDSELKAARLLGLGPGQFLAPMLVLGLAITVLGLLNNELVVPASERRALEVQRDILLRSPESFLEEGAFFTDALGRSIFIERLRPGGRFEGVTVIQPGGPQGPSEVITAGSGHYQEAEGVWTLTDLEMRVLRNNRLVLDFQADSATMPVRGLAAGSTASPDPIYLPLTTLLQRLREAPGRPKPAEWTALHRKGAEPLAATAFAIFALAVTMVSYRRGTSLGLVSVLILTFVYYATWSVAKLLGAQGTVPAWIAGWTPVMLYGGAAALLLARAWRR